MPRPGGSGCEAGSTSHRSETSAARGRVEQDGKVVRRGTLPRLDLAPRATHAVKLDVSGRDAGAESFVTFRFFLRRSTDWAPAGHEVAWQQIALPGRPQAPTSGRGVRPREARRELVLEAGNAQAVIERKSGLLVELSRDGRPALLGGPRLQLWRAPTDNDGIRLLPMRDQPTGERKALARWLELGLDRVVHRLVSVEARRDGIEVVHRASGRRRFDDAEHRQRFRLLPGGELIIDNDIRLGADLRDLPRIGVSLELPGDLTTVDWLGLGPWENHSDRQAAATVGSFTSAVDDLYTPYILPQENGHRGGVRRLALRDGSGHGLGVLGRPTFGFTASRFSAADLYTALHTVDLTPRSDIVLSIDHAQRGLGTASCGPDTLPQYRLTADRYRFSYALRVY